MVSIIVPVYNVEPYLGDCLDSIQAQTFRDLEVLMVDDGSTDHSARLCAAMAEADGRFRLLRRENAGVSAARNAALDEARGEFVQFVDGDDRLTPDATETLVREARATGAGMVAAHFYRVSGDRCARQGHIKDRRVMTREDYANEMVKAPANYYYGVLWNKLYRRDILERHGLRCAVDVRWGEDFLFNLEYIRHVKLIAAVPKPVYYYLKRSDSLVNTQATLRRTIQMKRMTFDYYRDLYQDLDLYDEQKARVCRYLISSATDGLTLALPEELEELLEELRRRRQVQDPRRPLGEGDAL